MADRELPGHGKLQNTRFNVGSFMCAAASSGDKKRLEWVIGLPNGVDELEYRNSSNLTPLLIACSKGHKDCAALLLENGADLNATAKIGNETHTCLSLAEKNGHTETINFIKKCHSEVKEYGNCLLKLKRVMTTICSKSKCTAEELERLGRLTKLFGTTDDLFDEPLIIRACKAGNQELIEHMVDNLHLTHYSNDSEGSNMLHIAVKHKSEMRYYITQRFPELLSTIDIHGRIPLYFVCDNNDIDYVKWLFDLVLMEIKPKRQVPPTPPSTPLKYIGVSSPPFVCNFGVVEEEPEAAASNVSESVKDSGQEVVSLDVPHEEKKGMTTSLSSSEVKLLVDDLQDTIPSGPLIPVTYQQHVKNIKLYAVDTEGENILHVMVKKNHHQLLDYILKTYPKFGYSPAQRDFWARAERVSSPIEEAITRGHAECLDILIEAIIYYLDPTKLYSDESLLPNAVISDHTSVVNVLIKHGIHRELGKSLCVACNRESLALLLFYSRVVDIIKGGEQYIAENAAVLIWRDYLLPRVQPLWIKLASDAIDIAQSAFSKFADLSAEALIKQIGPVVLSHYSQHINEPIECSNLQCFTMIQLSENELETVPEELFSLPCLKELDLSSNQISHLPAGPSAQDKCYPCNCLKTLTIRNNLLTTLPSWLFLLPNLVTVDAYRNKIGELPTAVWISSSLRTLNLSDNRLSQLHDLSGVQDNHEALRPKLDVLYLQLNYQENFSEVDKRRSSSVISPDTGSDENSDMKYDENDDPSVLCNLRQLDLSYNKFTSVPKDLACLAPKLEKLLLNCNSITDMDLVKDLPATITTINLHSCGIKDASAKRSLTQKCGDVLHLIAGAEPTTGYCDHCSHDYLASLGSLNLKNNKLSTLQVAGYHNNTHHPLFPALSVLDVSNNQMVKVPDHLELLTELSSINLSDNLITSMPFSISQLSQLWVINLENLNLSNVPSAIRDSHSASELKNYLKNLHQKSQPYRRMKLMFVGESNKGKTSLLMALTKKGRVNHYQDIRLNPNRKPLSTVGVDLGDWEYAKPTNLLLAGKKITFMTWDFGGQEEYYATHQCFLSPHALYILVWNVMDGTVGLERLSPWLENIESRAMGAQVIVVGTHVDQWDTQSPHHAALEEAFTKKFRELYIDCDRKQRRTYPKIMDKLFFVDTNNKDHISKLRDAVYDYALEYKVTSTGKKNTITLLEELVPACYILLEESVRAIAVELRNKKQVPILKHHEYIERINDCAKMNTTELKQATQFLHEKGILLHYDEGELSDLYFVDPQWLCSMLAKVIAIPEVNAFQKKGFIGRNELSRVLGPREHVDTCISLMQKFEVLFELDNHRYLIPSLLPVAEEQSRVIFPRSLKVTTQPATVASVPAIAMGSHSNCLVRFFMLPFIPNGMFPRLLARLIATEVIEHVLSSLKVDQFVDDQQLINRPHWKVWRSGIMLVWRHIQIFRIVPIKLPLPGINVVHVIQPKELHSLSEHRNVYEGDSLMVQVDILPDNAFTSSTTSLQMATWLLQQAVEQINSVFENWYEEFAWKRNIDITVAAADPCPHCMKVVNEHLVPDQYAAQKRLVDEPKAQEEAKVKEKKKKSILGSMTVSRTISLRFGPRVRSTAEALELSQVSTREGATPQVPTWSSGRLYGVNESVLYLFSVKLSAVAVMEKTVLTCPSHGPITIDQIAPDMIFADLALSMRVSPQNVTQKNYLDEGGFGVIYTASVKLQDGKTHEVVIKAYSQSEGSLINRSKGEVAWHYYQNANTEGRIMASLRHPNILKLVGIALQPIRLLLEFAPLGSLKNVVNRYQDSNARINRYALQKIICQVSSAMEYIHYNKIIYRDLKLANVLVFEFPDARAPLEGGQQCKVLVKLADYGISKQIVPWGIRGMLGTPSYLPPEVILHGGKQAYTKKIDVYSFGMMLSYLFTYTKPFGKIIRPLRAYLEAGQRPDMSPKHRPSCEWMYELMCWSWSNKPHHRPSFAIIRQLALSQPFTRLHYAMKVEPTRHLVTAIAVRYYKSFPTAANEVSASLSYPLRNLATSQSSIASDAPKLRKLSLQFSGSSITTATDDNVEVYYGTDYGLVGVADLQQSASSCQSVDDMKSPVTCMLMVNDYLWVGSHSGVKVFNAVNRQPVGYCATQHAVTAMILVPHGHYDDNEALVMPTKSSIILIFTVLQWSSERLLEDIKPTHEIELDCVFCALLVPTINQLWVCSTDSKLVVFNPGLYGNPEKYSMPDISNPCCMATVNDAVLIAAETRVQKWDCSGQLPNVLSSVDCKETVMEKVSTIHYDEECHITSMLGIGDVLYAGTRGGAIIAIDVDKMIVHGVVHVQTSAVMSLALLQQSREAKVTTLKRKQDALVIDHTLHHDSQDDDLLVSFALGYHGITYDCDSRPTTYNLPTMTSQCRYHQPSPTHNTDDLYMLLWSAHPWQP